MITIEAINNWREMNGLSPFRETAAQGMRAQTAIIHTLEEHIKEFEASPKKQGNREHFFMLLNGILTKEHAQILAFGEGYQ